MNIIEKKLWEASRHTAGMLKAEAVYGVELYAFAFAELGEAIRLVKDERKRVDERYAQGGMTYLEFDARAKKLFDLLCWAAECRKAAADLMFEHFSTLEFE